MADRYASLKQGLVGAWIPSMSGSGLLLPDLSGRGNNGALTNMDASDWVSSQYGRALDFDNLNDHIAINGAPYSDLAVGTVCFHIRTTQEGCLALSFQRGTVLDNVWFVGIGQNIGGALTNELISIVRVSGSTITNFSGYTTATRTELLDGLWHHIAIVCASEYRIFLDGRLLALTLGTGTNNGAFLSGMAASVNSLYLGGYRDGAAVLPINGHMDDVRVYSRALTESEIRLLSSEPGIGFKPAKKLSRFSTRYTYKPPKAKVFEGVRVRDHDYASLRQGLVGAWCPSLPNGGSGNTLPDQSGRGNHGTLTNMGPEDWVSSQYGRAMDFDGVNDEVTTNAISSLNSATQFTITYWASKNSALSDMLVGSRMSSTNGVWLQWFSDGVVYFSVRNGQQNFIQHSLTYRSDFIHFAATYSNTSSAIYIDGRIAASGTNGTVSSTGFDDFGIGALSGGFFAAGKIDDIRIYNRVLSESEIRLLASRPGIGLQPSPTRFIAREKKTGLRRKILTGQT